MGRPPVISGQVERVKSADRALDLLELLAARNDGITFQEVAAELNLPKSSAHGLLQTLVARGYAELSPGERRFRLGPKASALAWPAARSRFDHASALVAQIARVSGETAHLAELDGVHVRFRVSDEGHQRMRLVSPGSTAIPAHATAAGKALLATLSDDEIQERYAAAGLNAEALPQLTPRTTRRLSLLQRELDEVRRLGHAHDVEGYAEGVHCVAVALHGGAEPAGGGAAWGALSLSVATARLDPSRVRTLVGLLEDARRRLDVIQPDPTGSTPAAAPWRPGLVRVAWAMRQLGAAVLSEAYRAVSAHAAEAGADVMWANATTDECKQACDVAHLLDHRPDVLVLHPAHTVQSDALFRAAADAGIPAICFQRPARSDAFALFAGGNTYQVGEAQIEYVGARLGARGNVVLLEGDAYNDSARNLAEGSRRAFTRFPRMRLIADEVCPDWSAGHARRAIAELLDNGTTPRIDAIVCANDAMAGGAAEALAERGLTGRVVLVGHDGDHNALARLRAGAQDATFFQNPSTLAIETLRAAVALARGTLDISTLPRRSPAVSPPARPVAVLDVPYQRVTAGNLDVLGAYWSGVLAAP